MIGRIVEAQEAERGRIARELHDEFGQHLASVLLGLRLVEQAGVADEAKEAMTELVVTINAAIASCAHLPSNCGRQRSTTSGWCRRWND